MIFAVTPHPLRLSRWIEEKIPALLTKATLVDRMTLDALDLLVVQLGTVRGRIQCQRLVEVAARHGFYL